MATISELRAKFTATAEGFKSAISEAKGGLDELGQSGGDGADKANSKFGGLKSTIAGFAGAYVGLEAVKGFATTVNDLTSATNGLQTATGASDKEMKGLESSMKNIYAENFGADFKDIGDSLGFVKSATGLTGKALEGATKNALMLRDTYDMDVSESIKTADTMAKQFGITHDEAMTLIAQGAQQGLNKHDDLLDTFNEYSTQFKGMGMGAEDMFNVIASGADNGAFNMDKVGDSIKEFRIRLTDGSDATSEALDVLFQPEGFDDYVAKLLDGGNKTKEYADLVQKVGKENADIMLKDIGRTGKAGEKAINLLRGMVGGSGEFMDGLSSGAITGSEAMQTVIQKIQAIEDPIQRNMQGVALFGTQWEDLDEKTIAGLAKVKKSGDMSADTLKKMNAIKYNDLGSAITGVGRQLTVGMIEPVQKHVLPALNKFANWIVEHMPQIKNFLGGLFSTLGVIFGTLFAVIGPLVGVLATIITTLLGWKPFVPIVTALGVAFGVFYAIQKAGAIQTAIITKATKLWALAQGALNAIMLLNPIGIVIALIAGLVVGLVMAYKHSETFREIVKKLWEGIKAGFQGIADYFSTFGEDVKTIFSALGNGIKSAFEGVMNFFTVTVPAKLESIKDKIMGFTIGIEDKFKALRDNSTGIFKTLFDYLYNTVTNITNTIMGIFHVFIGLFTGDTAKMKEGISQIWTALKSQLINIVSTLKDVVIGIFNAFKTGVMFVFNAYKTLVLAVFNAVKTAVTTIVTVMKDVIIAVVTRLKDGVMNIFNALKTGVMFIFNAYKTFVLGVFNAVKNAVITIVTALKNALITIFTTLKNGAINIFNAFKTGVNNIFSTLKNALVGIWNAIKSAVVNAVTSMKNTVVSLAQTIWTSVVGKFNGMKSAVVGSVRALFNGVVEIFNNLVGKAGEIVNGIVSKFKGISLVETGKDLIRGLWNGISAMGDWIKDKVGGLADAVITKTKKVFGVKSPSRIFKSIGGFLGQGLALGIEDTSNLSVKATENMANDVVSSGVPQLQGGALSGALDFGGLIQAIGNLIQTQAPLVAIDNMSVRDEQDIQKVSRDLQGLIDKSRRSKGYKS
jgi:phage-related minor tail protein